MSIRQQMPGQVSARLLFPRVNPRFELPGMSGASCGAAVELGYGFSTEQDWAPRVDSSSASAHREGPVLGSIP